jgi:hypothetical protein
MKTNKLSVKFPLIIAVVDYHEFYTFKKTFSDMFGVKVKYVEINISETDDDEYSCRCYGYFYTGKRFKNKKELKDFIKKNPDRIIDAKP